jgi:hypothetical protein
MKPVPLPYGRMALNGHMSPDHSITANGHMVAHTAEGTDLDARIDPRMGTYRR